MKLDYLEALDFLWDLFEVMTRRDCGLILAGARPLPSERSAYHRLYGLERRGFVARRGNGKATCLELTDLARRKVRRESPAQHWDRHWDGKWRIVSYDLPMSQSKQRVTLCKELHAHKLGLLQQSMWIWPHDVQPILQGIVNSSGIPECFCGFEANKLFLCDNAQLVKAAWNFEEIQKRHQQYLQHLVATPEAVRAVRDLAELGKLARIEQEAYRHAFSLDPMLPRKLNPRGYRGYEVQAKNLKFRKALRDRVWQLGAR